MRLQVDNKFQQVKIKDLNDINKVEMFTTAVRGGKVFAAEQKLRELKTRIAKINAQKLKISRTKIIEASTANINLRPSRKYGMVPEEIEQRALSNERFRRLKDSNADLMTRIRTNIGQVESTVWFQKR